MASIALAARSQAAADLALAGLTYVASMEGCACPACQRFDLDYDADILAADRRGRPVLVAYRYQPEYEYQTITVRRSTDRGSRASQVMKILRDRSLADWHIQGYRRWITYAPAASVRLALLHPVLLPCGAHPRTRTEGTEGAGGQTFVTLCADCCTDVHTVWRADMAVQSVTSA